MHDLGGMQGFGPVVREVGEPVFHHEWERRVFGLNFAALPRNVDQFRLAIESIDPLTYLASSYYERWLLAIEHAAVAGGIVTEEELAAVAARVRIDGVDAVPRRELPDAAAALVDAIRTPAVAPQPDCGALHPGDRVRVRRSTDRGHTRCPRYVRGATGVIEQCLGQHPLPDAGALGERRMEHLYSVAVPGEQLWVGADHTVLVDLWESYLEQEDADAR